MHTIKNYCTKEGRDVFDEWLNSLRDRVAIARIIARISRIRHGNLEDCKPLREGVWELRIDVGPGYRVYYAMSGESCVLLLLGGDKRRQASDIKRAISYWRDYQQRPKS